MKGELDCHTSLVCFYELHVLKKMHEKLDQNTLAWKQKLLLLFFFIWYNTVSVTTW